MVSLRIPVATYRVQVNRGLPFAKVKSLVPYLNRLGITDLYSSPVIKARHGSSHGYDITYPAALNSELGTEQEFDSLIDELKANRMGLLLDIVPNHMSASPENPWWMDVLEKGRSSIYAQFFDINWNHPDPSLKNKVILPILGSNYRQVLEEGELVLMLDGSGIFIDYSGFRLPLNIKSYSTIIGYRLAELEERLGTDSTVFQKIKLILNSIESLHSSVRSSSIETNKIHDKQQAIKDELQHLINISSEAKSFLSENIALFNDSPRNIDNLQLLDRLLSQQAYKIVFWKSSLNDINYRRFFDINDLVGLRVEEYKVFKATHSLILRLIREGRVTGLRIDHIDGLYNPLKYLRRLQYQLARRAKQSDIQPKFYIVVEKILSGAEFLPEEWPVYGTTGYDYLNAANGIFLDEEGNQVMKEIYARVTGFEQSFEDIVYQSKKKAIEELFTGEIIKLWRKLVQLSHHEWCEGDLPPDELWNIIIEVTCCLPIYRTYIDSAEVSLRDRLYLEHTLKQVQQRNPDIKLSVHKFIKRIFLLDFPRKIGSKHRTEWLHFVMQWQQYTGAVMAKGVEDTAFYNYNCLISLNEVGGSPDYTVSPINTFHLHNLNTQKQWPYTLNTTATHDTKRGEDVRTRIDVLSEMPLEWEKRLCKWRQLNHKKKLTVKGQLVPSKNIEIFYYQTLLGSWPLFDRELPSFKERLKAYMLKAARETKVFTSWISPDSEYESALLNFVDSIIDESENPMFLKDFLEFQRQIAYYGALNSIAQVLLKITSPGVPDFYQGAEFWDLNLVDPDNRRPVDFEKRRSLLDKLIEQESENQVILIEELLRYWGNSQIKLYVTYKLLNARRDYRELFLNGEYIPLKIDGVRKDHVCAFARHWQNNWALIVSPRLLSKLVRVGELPIGRPVWKDDLLILPENAPRYWSNLFTGDILKINPPINKVSLANIFNRFPLALMMGLP